MLSLLSALLTASAIAGEPSLDCDDTAIDLPEREFEFKLPKGFAWEGLRPVADLADGRAIFARSAALDGLKRKHLRYEDGEPNPLRMMEIVVVEPDGSVQGVYTVARGTLIEAHSVPAGGVVLAHRVKETTQLIYLPRPGASPRVIALPATIANEETWRDLNPVKGTGPARIHPISSHRVVYAYGGEALSFDVTSAQVIRSAPIWSTQILALLPEQGAGEIVGLELGDRLVRFDSGLTTIEHRACVGCRLVALRHPTAFTPTTGVSATATGDGIAVTFLRADQSLSDLEPSLVVPFPDDLLGASWAWSLRAGPDHTALISMTRLDDQRIATTVAVSPEATEPVWTWRTDRAGKAGQHLVADTLGTAVRLRMVTGEQSDQTTHTAAIYQPAQGHLSDWVRLGQVDGPLNTLLFATYGPSGQGVHSAAQPLEDPMFSRVDPGAHRAELRRCTPTSGAR